jgi:hypothetical protein
MNGIRHIRRLASVLAGLAGVLLASAAAVPAAFAGTNPIPDPAGYIGDPYIGTTPVAPVPATIVHVINTGGMPAGGSPVDVIRPRCSPPPCECSWAGRGPRAGRRSRWPAKPCARCGGGVSSSRALALEQEDLSPR